MADTDLRGTLRILWRRKFVIAATVAVVVAVVAAIVFTVKPTYTAKLVILFDSKVGPVFDLRAAAVGQPQDEASVISEIEVIKSRRLAWRVIQKLGLEAYPDFKEGLCGANWIGLLIQNYLPKSLLANSEDKEVNNIREDRRREYAEDRVIDGFMSCVWAKELPRSREVAVSFTSSSPEIAADVLNSIAELYVVARLEDKFENAKLASNWLSARMKQLKEDVEDKERAVEDYRKQHGLFRTDRGTLLETQIADLNTKLTDAAIARQGAEANLEQARRLLHSSGQMEVETASEVLKSELVQRFREQELALERKEADMSQQYGAQYPLMIQLRAEKERLQEKLELEIRKIVSALENEVQVRRDREAALRRDQQALKSEIAQAHQASVGLESLQRNAEASRLLLQKFMTAFMETSAQQNVGSQLPDTRIISRAAIPDEPSFPKKAVMLAIAAVGGTVIGVLLAFALEHLDAGFRSAEQVEAALGLAVLAHVPLVGTAKKRGEEVSSYVLRQPGSAYADAIRSIYTRLMLTPTAHPPKVVLLTSAVADEGKTTLALALARQQTEAGRRVVVVDADFRQSQIAARVSGIAQSPGLSEVLAGKAATKDVVQSDNESALNVIVAGTSTQQRFDIPDSRLFREFLEGLRRDYDLIIIDSAPILALADTHVIATLADVTVMVVSWGSTRRRVVWYAMNRISKFGGQFHSVVLSKVNVRKHASYGYGDSGCYYRDATKYYAG